MGFNDLIKKTGDYLQKEKERKAEVAQRNRERMQMTKVMFSICSGQQQIKTGQTTTMFQQPTGEVFFGTNQRVLYRIIEYSWSGPQYNVVTNSTKTGTHTKKSKSGKIVAGAVIGGMINPVGSLIGAAAGAGGKGVTNINENTHSVSSQVEVNTPATLKLQNVETGQIASIVIACNTLIDSQIKCFNLDGHTAETIPATDNTVPVIEATDDITSQTSDNGIDAVKEIKRYKELLDIGAITQEEFDIKKSQLLNL